MPWETRELTRRELYDEVWATPGWTVAKKFGMTDVALAKHCRAMGVPRPSRGYWAKKAHGHAVTKTPLRKMPGARGTHTFSIWVGPGDPDSAEPGPALGPFEAPVPVPDILTDPHPVLVRDIERLQKHGLRVDAARGRMRCPAISVTAPLLDRAIRIADALFRACEAKGWRIDVTAPVVPSDEPSNGRDSPRAPSRTLLSKGDDSVEFFLAEIVDSVPVEGPILPPVIATWNNRRVANGRLVPVGAALSAERPHAEVPSGRLALEVVESGHYAPFRRTWRDHSKKKVEVYLRDVVTELESHAERKCVDRAARGLPSRRPPWTANPRAASSLGHCAALSPRHSSAIKKARRQICAASERRIRSGPHSSATQLASPSVNPPPTVRPPRAAASRHRSSRRRRRRRPRPAARVPVEQDGPSDGTGRGSRPQSSDFLPKQPSARGSKRIHPTTVATSSG